MNTRTWQGRDPAPQVHVRHRLASFWKVSVIERRIES